MVIETDFETLRNTLLTSKTKVMPQGSGAEDCLPTVPITVVKWLSKLNEGLWKP